jgi:sugar/nucleoside kinase (ribokinase family)
MIYAFGNPVYDEIRTPRAQTDGRVLSGCSTNFALALARLGRRVTLIGAIGKDRGAEFRETMNAIGVDTVLSESRETGGFSLQYYDDLGNRTLDLLGRAADIDFVPPGLEQSEAVLIGPILGETGFPLIRKVHAASPRVTMLDPQGLLRRVEENSIDHFKPEGIEEIVGLFDIVKPNELECKVLTDIDPRVDAEAAARTIFAWGPKLVVITLAEQGSVIFDGETLTRIPAYPADCVDATGAGDTYAAGFVHAHIRGLEPQECARWGTAVASVMIEHIGPDFPLTRAVIQERIEALTATADTAV